MNNPSDAWTDERTELIVSILLRAGVTIAALTALAGGVLYLVQTGGGHPAHSVFRGEPAKLRSLSGIVREAISGNGRGLIQLGLLILIATPVARVALSVYAFARERDWLYVGITLTVLAILAYSLFGNN